MTLAHVLDEYGDEFDIELTRMGVDLRDFADSESDLTIRRLWILYRALPERNLVSAAAGHQPPEVLRWGEAEHLLASVFDAITALEYTTRRAHTPKGRSPGAAPKPFPRPGAKPAKPRGRDVFPGKTLYTP